MLANGWEVLEEDVDNDNDDMDIDILHNECWSSRRPHMMTPIHEEIEHDSNVVRDFLLLIV